MRTIKYRQPIFHRDGKFKDFHYWGAGIKQGGEDANVGWLTFNLGITNPKDSQQFTGLTDKNGKEIYENDVCICPRNGSDCDRSLVVKYGGQCQFYLQEVESEKIFNMPMYSKNIEVIGNIYEHPNLLK